MKNWTLPIAMLMGIVLYFVYVNIPFLEPTKPKDIRTGKSSRIISPEPLLRKGIKQGCPDFGHPCPIIGHS